MMYCGMCGNRMEEGDEFCPECGKRTERKKKRILRNKFTSGRGPVTDYRGIVIKICVILIMLTVTGILIWGEEMAINMMNSADTVQWKTIISSEKNLISMYVEII